MPADRSTGVALHALVCAVHDLSVGIAFSTAIRPASSSRATSGRFHRSGEGEARGLTRGSGVAFRARRDRPAPLGDAVSSKLVRAANCSASAPVGFFFGLGSGAMVPPLERSCRDETSSRGAWYLVHGGVSAAVVPPSASIRRGAAGMVKQLRRWPEGAVAWAPARRVVSPTRLSAGDTADRRPPAGLRKRRAADAAEPEADVPIAGADDGPSCCCLSSVSANVGDVSPRTSSDGMLLF
mmetsp:Transcript_35954/g.110776  ORF Transcript_35954/g.110776 Transcript_35954/m.110776 type:complete len:239 (-) Transcript_35954:1792-2508(-)